MLQGFGLQGLGLGLIYLVEGSRSQGEARRSIPVLIILYPHSGLASNLSSILRGQPLTSYRIINKMNTQVQVTCCTTEFRVCSALRV